VRVQIHAFILGILLTVVLRTVQIARPADSRGIEAIICGTAAIRVKVCP